MTFSELSTVGCYKIAEVSSAMQKSIRRGDEDSALFWATELDLSGYGEYVFKRLRIISSEDIGLAAPGLVTDVHALHENWLAQRKKADTRHGPERLFLVHAVLLCARAPKSRLVDHALISFYEAPRQHRDIPDYALDKHTLRGKQLKRGHAHFWAEGAKIENAGAVADPYQQKAIATRSELQDELDI